MWTLIPCSNTGLSDPGGLFHCYDYDASVLFLHVEIAGVPLSTNSSLYTNQNDWTGNQFSSTIIPPSYTSINNFSHLFLFSLSPYAEACASLFSSSFSCNVIDYPDFSTNSKTPSVFDVDIFPPCTDPGVHRRQIWLTDMVSWTPRVHRSGLQLSRLELPPRYSAPSITQPSPSLRSSTSYCAFPIT